MTAEELDQQDLDNQESSQQMQDFPNGEHTFQDTRKYNLFVKVNNMINGDFDPMSQRIVQLNKLGVIFIQDSSLSTDGHVLQTISNSITMTSLIGTNEDLSNGRCCEAVTPIENGPKIKTSSGDRALYCFTIADNYNFWQFCSPQREIIHIFREDVRQTTVRNYADIHQLQPPDFIVDNDLHEENDKWSWSSQNSWKAQCQEGKYQSPITFASQASKQIYDHSLKFQYKPASVTAKFNGHEVELLGDFGHVDHISNSAVHTLQAYKVVFKFPQEHFVDNSYHSGELQVHHVTADGTQSIISFFIDSDTSATEHSSFWDNVSPTSWKLDVNQDTALAQSVSLQRMVASGDLENNYEKSFYLYKGSQTTPPCMEGVVHYIMKDAIKVPRTVVNALGASAFRHDQEQGNARRAQQFHDVILYQEDTHTFCQDDIPESIRGRVQEAMQEQAEKTTLHSAQNNVNANGNSGQSARLHKATAQTQSKQENTLPGHFIKTTANITTLVYTKPDDDRDKHLPGPVVTIDPASLPNSVKRSLLHGSDVSGIFPEAVVIPQHEVPKPLGQEQAEHAFAAAPQGDTQSAPTKMRFNKKSHKHKSHRRRRFMKK